MSSEIETAESMSDWMRSRRKRGPNRPASAIQGSEAEDGETETDGASGSEPVDEIESEAEQRALAIATDGGPVAVEIEFEPLGLRPLLQPSSTENTTIEPAVGVWGRYRLFIITVVLPMTIGALFLFAVETPRYVSSASFIVRSVSEPDLQASLTMTSQLLGSATTQLGASTPQLGAATTQLGASTTQLGASAVQLGSTMQQGESMAATQQSVSELQTGGATIAADETYAVNAYLTSRDIVDELAKNNGLRKILSRPEGDFLFRYPTFWLPNDSEFLYQRFQWMVSADVDDYTLVSTIEVNAFRPEDAQALADAMLKYAEALVNKMNQRSYDDARAAANRFVAEAQREVDDAASELQAYRNSSGSIDPNAVAQSKLKVIEGLSVQLAQVEAAIAQQTAIAPTSPTLASLRAQAQSFRDEIEKRKREIAGSSESEADKLQSYEELTIRGQLAATRLAAAVAERDQARQNVERQHLFIQIIARPDLARDYARYPRAMLDLLVLFGLCLLAFYALRKIGGVRAAHHP